MFILSLSKLAALLKKQGKFYIFSIKDFFYRRPLKKHIKDFLEFWMPRMPTTSYVRLSWLNTEQMNQLAPLHITPRPDTMIRVFLDFSGQATADTTLTPQTLTSIPRDGFTVIEWGGLLLGQ